MKIIFSMNMTRKYLKLSKAPDFDRPQTHCEFPPVVFDAMKDCFTIVSINGCFSHMAQNMREHLGSMQ